MVSVQKFIVYFFRIQSGIRQTPLSRTHQKSRSTEIRRLLLATVTDNIVIMKGFSSRVADNIDSVLPAVHSPAHARIPEAPLPSFLF